MLTCEPAEGTSSPKERMVVPADNVMIDPAASGGSRWRRIRRVADRGGRRATGRRVPAVLAAPAGGGLSQHPCALAVQDNDAVSLLQVVPVLLPHPPVGAGQTHAALAPDAPQTRPIAAQFVSASCRQACASAVQATSVLLWQ